MEPPISNSILLKSHLHNIELLCRQAAHKVEDIKHNQLQILAYQDIIEKKLHLTSVKFDKIIALENTLELKLCQKSHENFCKFYNLPKISNLESLKDNFKVENLKNSVKFSAARNFKSGNREKRININKINPKLKMYRDNLHIPTFYELKYSKQRANSIELMSSSCSSNSSGSSCKSGEFSHTLTDGSQKSLELQNSDLLIQPKNLDLSTEFLQATGVKKPVSILKRSQGQKRSLKSSSKLKPTLHVEGKTPGQLSQALEPSLSTTLSLFKKPRLPRVAFDL